MIRNEHFDLYGIPEVQKIGVYGIHNIVDDKYYIGSTTNLYHRFSLYFRCLMENTGINRKMEIDFCNGRKIEDFEIIIFEDFENNTITNLELRKKEREYIEKYNAIKNGYNTDLPNTGNIPDNQLLVSKDYMGKKRKNQLVMFLPLGTKDRWNEQAKKAGAKSLTRYITELIEREMQDNP